MTEVLRANEIMHHLELERANTGLDPNADAETLFDDVLTGLDAAPAAGRTSPAAAQLLAAPRPRDTTAVATRPSIQLSMFEPSDPALERIRELLLALDVNALTPIEALMKLNELKLALR